MILLIKCSTEKTIFHRWSTSLFCSQPPISSGREFYLYCCDFLQHFINTNKNNDLGYHRFGFFKPCHFNPFDILKKLNILV